MSPSISDAYAPKSKRVSKPAPHRRRVTVDTPCLSRPKPMARRVERRPSLPIKKSVSFSHMSEVCVFEPSPASEEWYTGRDHERFKRERLSDVVSFRERSRRQRQGGSSAPSSPGSCCPVGLEQLLSQRAMLEAHSGRKIVIRSVLVEQSRQRTCGVRDPDQIAFLSIRLSSYALEGALKRGKFQEMAKYVE